MFAKAFKICTPCAVKLHSAKGWCHKSVTAVWTFKFMVTETVLLSGYRVFQTTLLRANRYGLLNHTCAAIFVVKLLFESCFSPLRSAILANVVSCCRPKDCIFTQCGSCKISVFHPPPKNCILYSTIIY